MDDTVRGHVQGEALPASDAHAPVLPTHAQAGLAHGGDLPDTAREAGPSAEGRDSGDQPGPRDGEISQGNGGPAKARGANGTADGGSNGTAGTSPAPDGPAHGQPTIYDVARSAGVSIASVSRVLNGRRNPLPDTRERVLRAVAELGFIPDGAARALSARLKEVVGVVIRRPTTVGGDGSIFEDEEMSLQFTDLINRGIEVAAQQRDFNLLVCSVDVSTHDDSRRIFALARKSDGLILHDRVLDAEQLERLSRQAPVITLAGASSEATVNVRGDNAHGMRDIARHLVHDHGYRTLAYLGGHADSPDSLARQAAFAEQVTSDGATFIDGPQWQGNYTAAGGARVIERLLSNSAAPLPQAIACANDQTALGVIYALSRHGIEVPGGVAITGFDDIPVARHVRPQLTTVRQPIQDLGATAFETLYSMITDAEQPKHDIVLPTRLIRRESCGCPPETAATPIRQA